MGYTNWATGYEEVIPFYSLKVSEIQFQVGDSFAQIWTQVLPMSYSRILTKIFEFVWKFYLIVLTLSWSFFAWLIIFLILEMRAWGLASDLATSKAIWHQLT